MMRNLFCCRNKYHLVLIRFLELSWKSNASSPPLVVHSTCHVEHIQDSGLCSATWWLVNTYLSTCSTGCFCLTIIATEAFRHTNKTWPGSSGQVCDDVFKRKLPEPAVQWKRRASRSTFFEIKTRLEACHLETVCLFLVDTKWIELIKEGITHCGLLGENRRLKISHVFNDVCNAAGDG